MTGVSLVTQPSSREASTAGPPAELAFRVCGTEHDGRVVRISAAKCTIGSGKRCTFRLHARGVKPVHCFIVRGEQGVAVRAWSRETRLNGQALVDAPLRVGDRIGIGPLELEVLDGAAGVLPSRESTEDASWEAQRAELEERLKNEQTAARMAAERAAAWEQTAANRLSHEEFEKQKAAWESELAAFQQALGDSREMLVTELGRREDELEALRRECDDWKGKAGTTRQSFETQRVELERQLAAAHRQLAEKETQVAELWTKLTVSAPSETPAPLAMPGGPTAEAFEKEQAAFEAAMSDLRRELEQAHRAHEAERNRLQTEMAALRAAIDERESQLIAQSQSIEETLLQLQENRDDLHHERERFEEEMQKARANLAEERHVLQRQLAELDQQAAALRQPIACHDAQPFVGSGVNHAAVRDHGGPPAEIAEANVQATPADEAAVEELVPEISSTLVLPRRKEVAIAAAEPMAPTAPRPATGAAEVLARMGLSPGWDNEREEPAAPAPRFPESTPPSFPHAPPEQGAAGEEDESIDDYMARLLQRVRGEESGSSLRTTTTTFRPAPAKPRPATATPAAPTPAASQTMSSSSTMSSSTFGGLASILGGPTAKPPEEPTISPEEFVPRSHAPERSERLAAMRDLANSSARSAIDRYTKRRILSSAAAKLSMAFGALAAAVFLALFGSVHPIVAYAGAGVSGVCSVLWFVQGLRFTKQFRRARREGSP